MNRRTFQHTVAAGAAGASFSIPSLYAAAATGRRAVNISPDIKFGMVTYLWGKDWDLPTLIANCQASGVLGVELRTEHAHGVEANLDAAQRKEVKSRFANSPVELVGLGTNFAFHHTDQENLKNDIEGAKAYIKLSHDVGGSGVKVKPNDLPKGVPPEKTIEQIGTSLNMLGAFAADFGQEIRLEVHGGCSELPVIKKIMDIADHPGVGVCWNCNDADLLAPGLEYNFDLVRDRFSRILHARELDMGDYPYQQLIDLLVKSRYAGWVLLEARTKPEDKTAALIEQRQVFSTMVSNAQKKPAERRKGVEITEIGGKLKVEINGALFTEYNFKDVPRPYFYPVIGPTGKNITRSWPMETGENEAQDHVHHRSLWYAHGNVNGNDFWAEKEGLGRIVHDKFLGIDSGEKSGSFTSQNNWIAADGKVVCKDTRTHAFQVTPDGIIMDFDLTYQACNGAVTLGDTKEGSMAIRLAPTLRLKGEVAKGHIVNSAGDRDDETWGKRASWCDCYGPLADEVVGVAIFDHPGNPRHPTWWHVRNYGLFAANPFGIHDFEKKPKGTGDMVIAAGESLTFRYRFYFHKGDEKKAAVARLYQTYTAE